MKKIWLEIKRSWKSYNDFLFGSGRIDLGEFVLWSLIIVFLMCFVGTSLLLSFADGRGERMNGVVVERLSSCDRGFHLIIRDIDNREKIYVKEVSIEDYVNYSVGDTISGE